MKSELAAAAPPGSAADSAAIRMGVSIGYLLGQVYLEPNPKELMLRNHA